MEHYNRLTNLSGIQADADSLSVSGRTWTIRTSTTMGLGVASGRAIMAVGEFVLKGIETVQIHRTLLAASADVRNLQRNQSHEPLRNRTIAMLLELQRWVLTITAKNIIPDLHHAKFSLGSDSTRVTCGRKHSITS